MWGEERVFIDELSMFGCPRAVRLPVLSSSKISVFSFSSSCACGSANRCGAIYTARERERHMDRSLHLQSSSHCTELPSRADKLVPNIRWAVGARKKERKKEKRKKRMDSAPSRPAILSVRYVLRAILRRSRAILNSV